MQEIIASVLLAAIGSGITFLVQFIGRRRRDARLRRQYPASGLYATEFEDLSDGEIVVQKAFTRLEQTGLEVRGVTAEIDTGRCWELEGSINPGGFLSGIYSAEDPHDSGIGTFFLEIDGTTGDMDGLWAGYDSVGRSIEGGRYTFRRCPEVEIRHAKPTEIPQLVALLGDALGDRYVTAEDLSRLMGATGREACIVAVLESGRIAGAATVKLVSYEELGEALPAGQERLVPNLPIGRHHRLLGLIRAVAVGRSHRGRGIATRLTQQSLDWLGDHGATLAVSIGWKSPEGCHIEGVLSSCGFDRLHEVGEFWLADSREGGYSCPHCGKVCRCDAVIFSRSLVDQPVARVTV